MALEVNLSLSDLLYVPVVSSGLGLHAQSPSILSCQMAIVTSNIYFICTSFVTESRGEHLRLDPAPRMEPAPNEGQ